MNLLGEELEMNDELIQLLKATELLPHDFELGLESRADRVQCLLQHIQPKDSG